MTEMKSFMDFKTGNVYSRSYLDAIRTEFELRDIRENRAIGEYFIKKMEKEWPRMKDGYALFKGRIFSKQKIADALHYTLESESYHAPGRTKVASILPEDELVRIVNETNKMFDLIVKENNNQEANKK